MKLKKMTAFVLALAVLMTSFNLWDVKADTTDGSNHYMEEEEAYNESVINEYDNNEYSDIEPVISPDGSGSYNNPVVISDDTMQYDCVWFGNYWQNDTNGDGVADTGDEKEPIKWRVLQNREEELFLLSDKIIDVKAFYEDLHPRDERWARSTIRSWLNGYGSDSNDCNLNYSGNGFIDNAFSANEQSAIVEQQLDSSLDKIFFLSLSAAESGYYGFSIEYSKADYSRRAKSTRFASYKMNTSEWWLRTNPSGSRLLYYVDEIGKINSKWPDNNLGVRPALHISPNSPYISYAGTVASDGTVYEVDPPGSQKYTVTFDSNGGTSVSSQKVKSGGLVSKPSNPTKSGYTFDGWYSDSALTNKWNFSTDVVTYNMTLYAKWIENTVETYYTVTFDSNGGSLVSSQTVKSGGLVSKPSNPTKSGYTFDGWYSNSSLTNKWNFNTDVVTYNMTLYAKWIENSVETYYTVTFNSNGGTSVSSQKVKKGELVSKPSSPTRSGYTFDGWYSDSALTDKWDFAADVVTSITFSN